MGKLYCTLLCSAYRVPAFNYWDHMIVICSSGEAGTWPPTLLWPYYACNSKQTAFGKHMRSYLQCAISPPATS
jgi:hypothetical protein